MRAAPFLAVLIAASTPAIAETPRIVTDIPLTRGLVEAVAGESAEVTALVEGAGDPHSFQMRPSQARALADADLVIWVGEELTPWLDRALRANAEGVPRLALLDADGVHLREAGSDAHGHEDDAQGDHGHGNHGHGDHEHAADAHDGIDPHAWLDPANAAIWVDAIAGALSAADPAGADGYNSRAAALRDDIRALDAELSETLAPARDARLVFQHDAYGYLTGHFGIGDTAAIADTDGVDPGAGRMAELTGRGGAACIFGEIGQNPTVPERLAREMGAGFAVLDPTGAEVPPGPGHYRALMTGLAEAIRACVAPQG